MDDVPGSAGDSRRRGLRRAILRGDLLLGFAASIFFGCDVFDQLAVEVAWADAVGAGVEVVEHRPAEREAARLAGETPDHFRYVLDLAEAALGAARMMSGWREKQMSRVS